MNNILERAKALQRGAADTTNVWVKLSMLQDLIAEIERLELIIHAGGNVKPLRAKEGERP